MERGKKVLIVEPDATTAEKLHQVLGKERFSVSKTDRASEAIRAVQKEHFSVLILDVGIKDMAWDEMFAIVKGIDPGLPIIMTSDHNTPELEVSILRQRAFYYHVKSLGTDDLVLAVRSAIEKPLTHG
jgi:DNA-binding NtrC family response regulator